MSNINHVPSLEEIRGSALTPESEALKEANTILAAALNTVSQWASTDRKDMDYLRANNRAIERKCMVALQQWQQFLDARFRN